MPASSRFSLGRKDEEAEKREVAKAKRQTRMELMNMREQERIDTERTDIQKSRQELDHHRQDLHDRARSQARLQAQHDANLEGQSKADARLDAEALAQRFQTQRDDYEASRSKKKFEEQAERERAQVLRDVSLAKIREDAANKSERSQHQHQKELRRSEEEEDAGKAKRESDRVRNDVSKSAANQAMIESWEQQSSGDED